MIKKKKKSDNEEIKDQGVNKEDNGSREEAVEGNIPENKEEEQQEQTDDQEPGIDEWQQKFNELNDKHLRLFSEFDNFRKRTMREKSDLIKSASGELIKEMLPLLDDMDRALKVVPQEQKEAREGIRLIYEKFLGILKRKGLEEMDSMGTEFNTDYHEAITQIPAPSDDMKGKVMDVVEKGYFLQGKVLRYAKVVVGK